MKSNNSSNKVLVSTVGSWSDATGSNTMSELFRGYDRDKLACLYIRAKISDSDTCNHYFHINEDKVLKSIYSKKIKTGEEYFTGSIIPNSEEAIKEKERYNKYKRKKNWFYLFAREFVWLLGHWRSRELDDFIDSFDPDVLVCPIESYIHFNRINEYIIKRKHPKVVGFLWDDNFTYKQHPNQIGYLIHRWWLRHSVRRLVRCCDSVVALSPKMKEEADREFGIDCVLLTKPIFNQPEYKKYEPSHPIHILYTGNLYVNRDNTLACVVDAIRQVNKDGQVVILDVYTSTEIKPELEHRIKVDGCCVVHPPINQTDVLKLQKETDILLFIEDLHSKTGGDARLSFSTKITDYFCAGKCIWAVGNSQTSAMDYLQKKDAAICALEEKDIIKSLSRIVSEKESILEYSHKAWQCGRDFHNSEMIQDKLFKLI